jgi:hypothetical protein
MSRRVLILAGAVVATGLMLWLGADYHQRNFTEELFSQEKFNRDRWLAGAATRNPAECTPGARMAEDIKNNVIKPGMPAEEVVSLLGGPLVPETLKEGRISYSLGMCVYSEWQGLNIYLDPSNKVSKVELRLR